MSCVCRQTDRQTDSQPAIWPASQTDTERERQRQTQTDADTDRHRLAQEDTGRHRNGRHSKNKEDTGKHGQDRTGQARPDREARRQTDRYIRTYVHTYIHNILIYVHTAREGAADTGQKIDGERWLRGWKDCHGTEPPDSSSGPLSVDGCSHRRPSVGPYRTES